MKELHPNVTCVPAYYKYATDTFMPMVESGNCPTIFETWFTEPQKLIKAGAIADITDELEARGWLDKMNPPSNRCFPILTEEFTAFPVTDMHLTDVERRSVRGSRTGRYRWISHLSQDLGDELAETARPLRKRRDLQDYVSLPRTMPVDGISPTSHGTSVRPYVLRMMTELLLLIWIPMKQSQQWNM